MTPPAGIESRSRWSFWLGVFALVGPFAAMLIGQVPGAAGPALWVFAAGAPMGLLAMLLGFGALDPARVSPAAHRMGSRGLVLGAAAIVSHVAIAVWFVLTFDAA
ncbi:MAG: hypothetical protein H6531_02800 [Actinobacteria bacterium]|nr:hypothetical protein [Thermoleophilia bacterium]MCB9010744.1 hypothetical protein [Actinomycetota bacterium]